MFAGRALPTPLFKEIAHSTKERVAEYQGSRERTRSQVATAFHGEGSTKERVLNFSWSNLATSAILLSSRCALGAKEAFASASRG